MKRRDHPLFFWCVDHLVLLYVAVIVTAILPVVVLHWLGLG